MVFFRRRQEEPKALIGESLDTIINKLEIFLEVCNAKLEVCEAENLYATKAFWQNLKRNTLDDLMLYSKKRYANGNL